VLAGHAGLLTDLRAETPDGSEEPKPRRRRAG
jgi:hypothetical protein